MRCQAISVRPQLISPWCRIYVSVNWVSIGSDNGLSPVRRQAIAWTTAHLLSIGPLETNFSEIIIKIHTFSFKKMRLKMLSAKLAAILSRGRRVNSLGLHSAWWTKATAHRRDCQLQCSAHFSRTVSLNQHFFCIYVVIKTGHFLSFSNIGDFMMPVFYVKILMLIALKNSDKHSSVEENTDLFASRNWSSFKVA